MTNTYGEPTVQIPALCRSTYGYSYNTDVKNQVLVFDHLKKICLKGKMYDFSQITGYSVSVNGQIVSSSTKTSTSSAIGRAAVGGVLFGGVGAIIGASTAKKTTNYDTHEETIITIFTNIIDEPSILLDLAIPNKENVSKIEGVLRIISAQE